jgi:hypothetical protein
VICERANDHGGRSSPMAAPLPEAHYTQKTYLETKVNVVKSRKNIVIYTIMNINSLTPMVADMRTP